METYQVLGTPKRVVLGSVDNRTGDSPISPTANLKLLTKVATSYMDENWDVLSYPKLEVKRTPIKNRRQLRSLGFICKRFLALYNLDLAAGQSKQISLGHLTVLLDIEKRRVYDIINIIASLRYASKVCKDKYSWFGSQYLVNSLSELRSLAYSRKYHLLLNKFLNSNTAVRFEREEQMSGKGSLAEQLFESDSQIFFDDNRIGALCQKSIMLFLIAPKGEALSFKMISQIILPQDVQDKTGMRRLYDISNVLEALGLIRRCDIKHMKRPTFVYSGPQLPINPKDALVLPAACRRLTDIEHLSDTSLDGSDSVSSVLDASWSEPPSGEEPQMSSAKKRLFPEGTFLKAPCSSFRFTSAGLVSVNPRPNPSSAVDIGALVSVGRITRPLVRYKISSSHSTIQNGGIYKVIKQGNIISLVQLKSAN